MTMGENCTALAADLLHGCVRLVSERSGWVRPLRLTDAQTRAVGSCQAWHPGLLRQMARTSSGITIECETDATELHVELRVDPEPRGTQAVLDRVADLGSYDVVSADVDGHHMTGLTLLEDELVIDLDTMAEVGAQWHLPGMGENHRVRVWLPTFSGCSVRRVLGNGSYLRPVSTRPQLLVLGDSIAQGFVTGDPALAWPSVLADRLGHDLVNQGLGGQVFQPGTLLGLAAFLEPDVIVVALGENYRYEPCSSRQVVRDVRSYLAELVRLWPDVPTYVVTPLWHDETASPSHRLSCWRRVPSIIAAHAAVHDHMTLVDGMRLMDHDAEMLADADGHPNARGAAQVAERLHLLMQARAGTPEERRQHAMQLLAKAPRRAFPLLEAARRGIGEFVFVDPGCVLLDVGDDQMMLYAPDYELGRAALAVLCDTSVLCLMEPELIDAARELGGYVEPRFHHLAIYRKKTAPKLETARDIRVLDESYLDAVRAGYSHPEFFDDEELRARLAVGCMLGAFEEDELVGFVGGHAEGSIGMLEVFEGHRRQGWGRALMTAKIAEALERGQVPWTEVFEDNAASVKLQRRLGMTVTPAKEQCYLWRRTGDELGA